MKEGKTVDNRKKKILMLQVINVFAYIVMITLNALANILPINNQTTGGVSDKYGNLFAPAGITFAIWGVIYVMLGLFLLYQWGIFTKDSDRHEEVVLKVGWLFAASSFANSLWILLWHHDMIFLTVLLMLVILACLIFITEALFKEAPDMKQRWLCNHAFSVYLGWISVATIANITTWFVSLGWNGFGIPEWVWTLLVMVVAAALASIRLYLRGDRPFSLVVVWALIGIVIKHITVFNMDYPQILIAGVFLVGWISAAASCSLMADLGVKRPRRPAAKPVDVNLAAADKPISSNNPDQAVGSSEPADPVEAALAAVGLPEQMPAAEHAMPNEMAQSAGSTADNAVEPDADLALEVEVDADTTGKTPPEPFV